jgi:hypothetical protein
MRKLWIRGTIVVVLWIVILCVGFIVFPTDRMAFRRFVCTPIPKSVSNLQFESAGALTLRMYGCGYFRFSMSRDDVARLVQGRHLERRGKDDMPFVAQKPAWFRYDLVTTNGDSFTAAGKTTGGRKNICGSTRRVRTVGFCTTCWIRIVRCGIESGRGLPQSKADRLSALQLGLRLRLRL